MERYTVQNNKELIISIENSLQNFLPSHPNSEWFSSTFGSLAPCITNNHAITLIEPCRRLMDLGGKRWRPLLLLLCARATFSTVQEREGISLKDIQHIVPKNAFLLTPLVEFCHTASLMHDDIEDNTDVRRGETAAHIVYGTDTALNAASWLYFTAPTCIEKIQGDDTLKLNLYKIYTKELRKLHLGQALDIKWHKDSDIIPSIDEYNEMVQLKTGTLASLAVQVGFIIGGANKTESEQAGHIAAEIGIGFQILDDVQNLTTGNPGKQRGDDIIEGKKSLPVLLYLKKNPEQKKKISELFLRAKNEGIHSTAIEEFITLLNKSGCIIEAAKTGTGLIESRTQDLVNLFSSSSSQKDRETIIEMFNRMTAKMTAGKEDQESNNV